jgi:glycine zipper 2TM protein
VKTKPILIAAALALAGTAGVASAQYANNYQRPVAGNNLWQGAPDGLQQRIDWLQQRITRGMADGSLDRREARSAQLQLNDLRRQADVLNQRLDNLSRSLRWQRGNGGYNRGAYNGTARDPYATDYDASRYYRDDPRYQERRLSAQDEVYRGSDGRYYCKRSDGTTGLIVGGLGGAALGNVIDGGHNRVAGTLIGGALGALLGKSVDQNNSDVRCR